MLYVFIVTVVYCSTSPLSNLLSNYTMYILKLLPCICSSPMVSCIPIHSYLVSVSTKYNTKMQVQKKHKIHNNNTVKPSTKITQRIFLITDIVQPHWKSCLRKQATKLSTIIGLNTLQNY